MRETGEAKTYDTKMHDPLRDTHRNKPVDTHNRFQSLTNHDDGDDDDDNDSEQTDVPLKGSEIKQVTTTSHNGKRKRQTKHKHNSNFDHHNGHCGKVEWSVKEEEAIRDVAAKEGCRDDGGRAMRPIGSELPQSWHLGPEHIGCLKEFRPSPPWRRGRIGNAQPVGSSTTITNDNIFQNTMLCSTVGSSASQDAISQSGVRSQLRGAQHCHVLFPTQGGLGPACSYQSQQGWLHTPSGARSRGSGADLETRVVAALDVDRPTQLIGSQQSRRVGRAEKGS